MFFEGRMWIMRLTKDQRLAREIAGYRGEYVVVKSGRILAHDPDMRSALAKTPSAERVGVEVRRVPVDDTVTATFSAL
jgi:hypothetical protein